MKENKILWIAESAIIAALYVALTWLLAPISYGAIQFRMSEILVLLVLFKPSYSFALILGCFVSNIPSSLGVWDMLFGTIATALAILPMLKIKKIWISAIFPVISNGIIVALELYFALGISPIWYSMLTVGFGEAVVLYFVGIPVMIAISRNEAIVELLHFNVDMIKSPKIFTMENSLSIALSILGVILFIAYPFYSIVDENGNTYYSVMNMVQQNPWVLSILLFVILDGLFYIFTKKRIQLFLCLGCVIGIVILFILIGIFYKEVYSCGYYYGYLVYVGMLAGMIFCKYQRLSVSKK